MKEEENLLSLRSSDVIAQRSLEENILSLRSSDVIAQRSLRKEEYPFACDVADDVALGIGFPPW